MKFTYSWLSDHLDTKLDASSIGEMLTNIGLELENLTDYSKTHGDFVVASIVEFKKHPNADRLNLCTVNDGSKTYQVVCGAHNVKKDFYVSNVDGACSSMFDFSKEVKNITITIPNYRQSI